jgi:iron complex transport system ATP-binding protein
MSAGEKRRVPIARALVHRAPTAAAVARRTVQYLDLAAQRELRETLRKIARNRTGLVLATDHLDDILPVVERISLRRDGRIVADGPRGELLIETALSELFRATIRIGRGAEWLHSW